LTFSIIQPLKGSLKKSETHDTVPIKTWRFTTMLWGSSTTPEKLANVPKGELEKTVKVTN
jgi:hypothetical protein